MSGWERAQATYEIFYIKIFHMLKNIILGPSPLLSLFPLLERKREGRE